MTRIRSRSALTAVAVLAATIGAGAGVASPAFALPPASTALCPPATAEFGVQYFDQDVYDSEDGPYEATIVDGAFPGIDFVKPRPGLSYEYSGAPTKLGVNTFTVELRNEGSFEPSRMTCTVTVESTVTLDPATISVERLDAADRYAEAVAISKRVAPAPATAPLVYLASGEGFSDALSGASVAAQHSAPLLLSSSTTIPAVVADELKRLAPADVVVLGGEATLKPAVVAQLEALVPGVKVTRIGGADRYEVSRNVISDATFGAKASYGIYIASGRVFPDALSATPAAVKGESPVLLVDGQENAFTPAEMALITSRKVISVAFLGGTNTISAALGASFDYDSSYVPMRIGGADRYFVSSGVAHRAFVTKAPMTADTVYIATGANFPDALAGGVLAGLGKAPILLATKDCIPADAADRINRLGAKKVVLLGGTASLGDAVAKLTVCKP